MTFFDSRSRTYSSLPRRNETRRASGDSFGSRSGVVGRGQLLPLERAAIQPEQVSVHQQQKPLAVPGPLDLLLSDTAVLPIEDFGGRRFQGGLFESVERDQFFLALRRQLEQPELAALLPDEALRIGRPLDFARAAGTALFGGRLDRDRLPGGGKRGRTQAHQSRDSRNTAHY